jgi:hypothetical protein
LNSRPSGLVSTIQYKFSGLNQSRNPIFEVICPSGVVLARVPIKGGNWHSWISSEDTHISKGTTYRFTFIFDNPGSGGGPTISVSKSITFAIEKPPQ